MDKKLLLLLVAGIMTAMLLSFGVIWWIAGGGEGQPAAKQASQARRNPLQETGTIDLFRLVLPGRQTADGDTAVVHADLQLVVPLRHRIAVESQTSKIRDIIGGILRNSDVPEMNRDGLATFKHQLIAEVRRQLGIEITEVLVLRFSYDIVSLRRRSTLD